MTTAPQKTGKMGRLLSLREKNGLPHKRDKSLEGEEAIVEESKESKAKEAKVSFSYR